MHEDLNERYTASVFIRWKTGVGVGGEGREAFFAEKYPLRRGQKDGENEKFS